ncbi:FAD-binding oxidoreductase [Aliiroseovarius crassostreae]|uniref:NAD(P)/FAD-dependent oxidoreductase n=1 Tax=Aliiroseovarius crassostreae TaxID=154981 RepID=UPI00220C7763|nr:FAD-binding oxidoreductase [Aliiroseovarius crassostreae]UWQ02175.1 FAD-binding oxidoreductase [Aliiroseovarius crassostreae]
MFDFIIIGGGIAGISAGARLSSLGRVLVLEAEEGLAYHASGRSAAMFEENYGAPSVKLLSQASRPHHEAANVLTPRGLMVLALEGQERLFEDDLTELRLPRITKEDARDLVPILNTDLIVGAGYHPDAWDLDTDLLLNGFARELRQNGEIQTRARVTGITRLTHGWQVETTNGCHDGHILVNAAGPWADDIANMAGVAPVGLQAYRRSMARLPAPDGQDVSNWPMFMGAGESWYAKPDAGALIVSPADADPLPPQDAWADDMVLAEGLARYEEHVTTPVTRILANWAGLRTFAPDRSLVLGPAPADQGFIWCAGQGGYGMQSAPAASQLLADLVAGRQPDLPEEIVRTLTPDRFS